MSSRLRASATAPCHVIPPPIFFLNRAQLSADEDLSRPCFRMRGGLGAGEAVILDRASEKVKDCLSPMVDGWQTRMAHLLQSPEFLGVGVWDIDLCCS